jgi:hypothetical protein
MGWCDCMYRYRQLGLLDLEEHDVRGMSYAEMMRAHLGAETTDDLRHAAAAKMRVPADALPAWNLHWLGMFSDRKLEVDRISPLDAMAELMIDKLAFRPGERDMIVLYHDFRAEFPDGSAERITSRLIDFGIEKGDSSMSRTVSLPAAVGVHMILEDHIKLRGVLRPVVPEIYDPVLDELARLEIRCREESETL